MEAESGSLHNVAFPTKEQKAYPMINSGRGLRGRGLPAGMHIKFDQTSYSPLCK